jgi:hypothetical protein
MVLFSNFNFKQLNIVFRMAICFAALTLGGLEHGYAGEGGEVDNGGDVIVCDASGENAFVGYFSLDYLLTYQGANSNADVSEVLSAENSLDRIEKILESKSVVLAKSLSTYRRFLSNHSDRSLPRIWEEATFGLTDIKDEDMIRLLPRNCYHRDEEDRIHLIQAVIRESRPGQIIYHYDSQIQIELQSTDSLQLSFLLVHEWLWDHATSARVVRDANRYLHSKRAETDSAFELEQALTRIGLDLTRDEHAPDFRVRDGSELLEAIAAAHDGDLIYFDGEADVPLELSKAIEIIGPATGRRSDLTGKLLISGKGVKITNINLLLTESTDQSYGDHVLMKDHSSLTLQNVIVEDTHARPYSEANAIHINSTQDAELTLIDSTIRHWKNGIVTDQAASGGHILLRESEVVNAPLVIRGDYDIQFERTKFPAPQISIKDRSHLRPEIKVFACEFSKIEQSVVFSGKIDIQDSKFSGTYSSFSDVVQLTDANGILNGNVIQDARDTGILFSITKGPLPPLKVARNTFDEVSTGMQIDIAWPGGGQFPENNLVRSGNLFSGVSMPVIIFSPHD